MNWASMAEFFAMGGYGLYVWPSYAVTGLALAIEVWAIARRRRAALAGAARSHEEAR